jgi:quinoprotein dehydrogenase-associated probable ABC transporter substrate-binding protein
MIRRRALTRLRLGINKETTAMIDAALHRWLVVSLLAFVVMVIGREVSRAQTTEGTDLSIELVDPKVLRVCADPRNLPFSNEKGEGFENKLGELFAEKLQKKLDYMYYPQATGFVRMTLAAHRCDVIMGFPQGDDLVQGTNPYYRTAYALVAKQGSGLDEVATLEDARLKGKHIGIVAGTPPATNMAVNGLMANAKPYPLMIDTRFDSSAAAMIKDLTSGEIDAGVLWGPIAGYYAKQASPPLHVTPLVKETSGPRLAYRIGMGVRPADQNWKRQLNRLIQESQPAINKILLDFGVPLLDENDRPITAETTTKQP